MRGRNMDKEGETRIMVRAKHGQSEREKDEEREKERERKRERERERGFLPEHRGRTQSRPIR